MHFDVLNDILADLIDTTDNSRNYPIMISGPHGIGKSELVYQLANSLGLEVIERRASQMQEGELIGMPSKETHVTDQGTKYAEFDSFKFLADCCDNPRVLFLDEVDRAQQPVRQALMELCDSGKIFGKKLHPGTIIIAAVNGGKHGSNYQVGEMDPAELDRWTRYEVEPSAEVWLNWAKDKVNPLMWDFINHNREHLFHTGEYEPNEIYPTPRSIVRLDGVLTRSGRYDNIKQNLDHVMNLAMGFVGLGTAAAFREFALNYEYQLTPENIVNDGRWGDTTEWGINEHLAMTNKINNSGILNNKLSQSQLQNVADYFVTLPSEVACRFWILFSGATEDSDQNVNLIPFCKVKARNGLLVSQHYGKMLSST